MREKKTILEMMAELDPNRTGYVNYKDLVEKIFAKPPPPNVGRNHGGTAL